MRSENIALVSRLSRGRVFYGWYIVALAFLGNFVSTGIYVYTFPIFLTSMVKDLHTSRTMMSLAFTLGNLSRGLASPFFGGIIDRGRGKLLMVLGAIVTGLSLMAFSRVQSYWQFAALWSTVFMIGTLFAGGIVVNVAVSNWFVKKRGRAQGISSMGVSFGGVALPVLVAFLIGAVGWRTTWALLGILVWVLLIAPAACLLERRPEDVGLRPDGEPAPSVAVGAQPSPRTLSTSDVPWTRREALKTSTLWLITLAFGLAGMGLWMVSAHVVAYLQDIGYSRAWAASAYSVMAFAAFGAKPFWGSLTDKFPVKYVAVADFSTSVVGVLALAFTRQPLAIYAALVLVGVGYGGQMPLSEVLWANSFGRVSLATVRTTAMPLSATISSSSPLMGGLIYDWAGSYTIAFAIIALAWTVASLLILLSRRPHKPTATVALLH